jgi:hypothetical protein
MGRPKIAGAHSKRQAGVPELVEVAPHEGHPLPPHVVDVLDEDPARAELSDDPLELVPEAGPPSGEPGLLSGCAEILTRETAAQEVDSRKVARADGLDVSEPTDAGPVLGEDFVAEVIVLHLERALHAGPLEPEVDPADPREQRAEPHALFFSGQLATYDGHLTRPTYTATRFPRAARSR